MPREAMFLDGPDKEWSFGRLLDLKHPELKWQMVDSSLNLYACGFKVSKAEGLGINFSGISKVSGTLWVEGSTEILGGFDAACRPEHGYFAVRPLQGNRLVLWWQGEAPPSLEAQAVVVPNWKKLEGFGDSGDCLPDAVCPEALGWEDPRRSVVMMLTNNNTRFCTGTLVTIPKKMGALCCLPLGIAMPKPTPLCGLGTKAHFVRVETEPTKRACKALFLWPSVRKATWNCLSWPNSPCPNGRFFLPVGPGIA